MIDRITIAWLVTTIAFPALLLLALFGCDSKPDPEREIRVEAKLDDANLPRIGDARVVVLPTGERVLVMTGSDGLATCCLLPPLPAEKGR